MALVKTKYVTADIEVEVDLCEFDDEDIIDEVFDRGLVDEIIERATDAKISALSRVAINDAVRDAYSEAVGGRGYAALKEINRLLDQIVPPHPLSAKAALEGDNLAVAIIELDKALEPTKAEARDD